MQNRTSWSTLKYSFSWIFSFSLLSDSLWMSEQVTSSSLSNLGDWYIIWKNFNISHTSKKNLCMSQHFRRTCYAWTLAWTNKQTLITLKCGYKIIFLLQFNQLILKFNFKINIKEEGGFVFNHFLTFLKDFHKISYSKVNCRTFSYKITNPLKRDF